MKDITLKIDTSGTRCPIPLLRAKQALKKIERGELLKVIATDPSAKDDFDAMLKHLPHILLDYEINNDQETISYNFIIEKG